MTPEYITKDTLKETLINWSCDASYIEVETKWALEEIKSIPAADVAPIKHGKWRYFYIDWNDFSRCSCCRLDVEGIVRYNYCPNCGARMEDETDG